MKADIHPAYEETTVVCGCGNTFQTRSTKPGGRIVVEVCSQCHPFYTGKQKILDSGGRVARFEKRYGKRKAGADKAEVSRQIAGLPTPELCGTCTGRASVRVCGDFPVGGGRSRT